MLNVGDVVRLTKSFIGEGLPTHAEGTVVMCFNEPSEGYEVEFLDEDGYTKAVLTLEPGEFEVIWSQE